MKITRATFAVPEPRTSLIGLDLEEPVGFSFGTGEITGFVARFDAVNADGSSRRIVSSAFRVAVTPAEFSQLAAIYSAALARGGVVPAGTGWGVVETP